MVFVRQSAIQILYVLAIWDTLVVFVIQKLTIVVRIHVKTQQLVALTGQHHTNANVRQVIHFISTNKIMLNS